MISALIDHLAIVYQSGNMAQLAVIARNMLSAIPEDLVALQFLGLALYQMGQIDDAHRMFKRLAVRQEEVEVCTNTSGCEPAHWATFRAATQAHSGLADGWYRIGLTLNRFGFHIPARRAFAAAVAASGLILKRRRRATDKGDTPRIGHRSPA